jgi:hypothetical protein
LIGVPGRRDKSTCYEGLPIYKSAAHLFVFVDDVVRGFPRYHKYGLGQRLWRARCVSNAWMRTPAKSSAPLGRVFMPTCSHSNAAWLWLEMWRSHPISRSVFDGRAASAAAGGTGGQVAPCTGNQ